MYFILYIDIVESSEALTGHITISRPSTEQANLLCELCATYTRIVRFSRDGFTKRQPSSGIIRWA